MPNDDSIRIAFGTIGTGSSFALANAEVFAAVFAGLATGIYMLTSTWLKIRKPKK